jgi:hypothetical protein
LVERHDTILPGNSHRNKLDHLHIRSSGALTMRIVGAAPRDSGATGGNELTIRAFDR